MLFRETCCLLKKKKQQTWFIFLYSRVWSFAVLLSDIFYLCMAYFTSINIDFFFPPNNLKHPEMGLSFRRTWNWNENNTCWCSCLVPNHITQPGCSHALWGLWCFLHLGNFSLLFLKRKKSFTLTRLGPFWSTRVPYCTHSSWEDEAGFKESFGTIPHLIPGVCTLQINPGMKPAGPAQKSQWLHRDLLKLQ